MSKKRNLWKVLCSVLVLMLGVIFYTADAPKEVQAATKGLSAYKRITTYRSQKIGSTTYTMKYNDKTRTSTVYAKKNGKTKAIIKKCGNNCVTNGKVFYYSTGTHYSYGYLPNYKNIQIKSYTLSTGKTRTLYTRSGISGMLSPVACDGTYLYFGTGTQYGDAFTDLRVLNLKTGEIISTGCTVSSIQKVNNKILVSAADYPHGGNLCLLNRDGSGKKMITSNNVISVKVTKKYIYYTEATYSWSTRKCRCKLNGTGAKALTKWS